jgi:hypothetical protein
MDDPDFEKVFSRLSPEKRALVVWRKYANPDFTIRECLHDCTVKGHLPIPDWDRDIDWNEHYILLPQKCKICGLREFKVLKVLFKWSDEIPKRSENSV